MGCCISARMRGRFMRTLCSSCCATPAYLECTLPAPRKTGRSASCGHSQAKERHAAHYEAKHRRVSIPAITYLSMCDMCTVFLVSHHFQMRTRSFVLHRHRPWRLPNCGYLERWKSLRSAAAINPQILRIRTVDPVIQIRPSPTHKYKSLTLTRATVTKDLDVDLK